MPKHFPSIDSLNGLSLAERKVAMDALLPIWRVLGRRPSTLPPYVREHGLGRVIFEDLVPTIEGWAARRTHAPRARTEGSLRSSPPSLDTQIRVLSRMARRFRRAARLGGLNAYEVSRMREILTAFLASLDEAPVAEAPLVSDLADIFGPQGDHND